MTDCESTVRRLRDANPVASLTSLHEEEVEAVRSLLNRRRGKMAASRTAPRAAPRWRRPALVAAAAFIVTLIAVGSTLVLLRWGGKDVVAPVSTVAPTTTAPATTTLAPTTTAASTTTTEVPTTTAPPAPASLAMTWTQAPVQEAFGLNDAISSVIEGGPGLIAVGCVLDTSRGETVMGPADAAVWVSADGLTWERVGDAEVFGGPDSQKINDVVRGPDGYVAVGWGADPAIWFSPDGIEWEQATGQVPFLESVIADADGYLALGDGIWRSPDGRTWTRVDEQGFDPNWIETQMGNTMWSVVALPDGYGFVAGDDGGYYEGAGILFVSSPDGVVWTAVPITQEPAWVTDLGIVGGLLVATGGDADGLAHWVSRDNGVTWERLGTVPGRERNAAPTLPVADGDRWLIGSMETNYPLGVARVLASADQGLTWYQVAAFDRSPEGLYDGTIDQGAPGIRELIPYKGGFLAVGSTGNGSAPVWIGTWDQD